MSAVTRASRRQLPRSPLRGGRVAARGSLLPHAQPWSGDHRADVDRDVRPTPVDRQADALDDPDAAGAARDQEDPAEVQGRPRQAERRAAEVLPREQDQPPRRVPTALVDPADRHRGPGYFPAPGYPVPHPAYGDVFQ